MPSGGFPRGYIRLRVTHVIGTLRPPSSSGPTKPSTHVCITIVPQFDINGDIIDVPRTYNILTFKKKAKLASVCEWDLHRVVALWRGFTNMHGSIHFHNCCRCHFLPANLATSVCFRKKSTWTCISSLGRWSLISHSLKFTSSPNALRAELISPSTAYPPSIPRTSCSISVGRQMNHACV